jgi:heterodisulfide reductase subunit A2
MEAPRIGVYVCWCGTNIVKMVDVIEVTKHISALPNVVLAKDYKYMCSDPGQDLIVKDIVENKLNRIVVAACSPRMHENTFRKALIKAGVNQYLFEMANIREQNSWVHTDRDEATKKAISLVAAAVNRINWHEELEERTVDVNPVTLIIGGGISGLSAALEIANSDNQVYLVEKAEQLGGNMKNINLTFPHLLSAQKVLESITTKIAKHPKIEVFLNTQVENVSGYVGNFETEIPVKDGSKRKLQFGNVIVTTGLKPFDPSVIESYNYGKLPDVITSVEFEKKLLNGEIKTSKGIEPKNIAIIHCVGSRNHNYHEYCSRTCCLTALKYSNEIKSALKDANVYQIYADMRTMFKSGEEFYCSTGKMGTVFMMYDQKNELPVIKKSAPGDTSEMIIEMKEKLSGVDVEIPVDMVILMVGMEAQQDAKEMGHAVGISVCGNGFYIEKHPKLDPVATTTDGVFIAGACQGPKSIAESISQSRAAAARVLATICKGSVHVEVTTAVVNEEICCGCQTCIRVCTYTAISFLEDKKVSYVNDILCKGCGTCGSACPTGAIKSRHFTDKQILSQIEGLLQMSLSLEEAK